MRLVLQLADAPAPRQP